ncbi:MAG: hypothetical protein Q4G61_08680 [Tissierellia bacterium]|nr:hypothetical protein [Tissierellia bacterium]
MSAFLAPIHYNMFNKILNQDDINQDLLRAFGNEELSDQVRIEVGALPKGELETIIDHGNIHGWLQSQIDVVESSFSLIVDSLLNMGISKEQLIEWFNERGKAAGSVEGGEDIFRTFTNSFLDGMPCDRAIQPIELSDDTAKWVQNADVHGKYWSDGGITYNELRCAWINGLAENNGFAFGFDQGVYEVSK